MRIEIIIVFYHVIVYIYFPHYSLEVGWSTISSKSNVYQTHFHMNDGCEYYCTLTQEEIETIESVIHKASIVEAEEQLRRKYVC